MDNSKELRNVISMLERIVSNLAQTEGKRGDEKSPMRIVYTRPGDGKRFVLNFHQKQGKYVGMNGGEKIMLRVGLNFKPKYEMKTVNGKQVVRRKPDNFEGKMVEKKDTDGKTVLDDEQAFQATGLLLHLEGDHRIRQDINAPKGLHADPTKAIQVRIGGSYNNGTLRGDPAITGDKMLGGNINGNLPSTHLSGAAVDGPEGLYQALERLGVVEDKVFKEAKLAYDKLTKEKEQHEYDGKSVPENVEKQIGVEKMKMMGQAQKYVFSPANNSRVSNWNILPDGFLTYGKNGKGETVKEYDFSYLPMLFGEGAANKASPTMQSLIMAASKYSHKVVNRAGATRKISDLGGEVAVATKGWKCILQEVVPDELSLREDAYMGMLSMEDSKGAIQLGMEKVVDNKSSRITYYKNDEAHVLYYDKETRLYQDGKTTVSIDLTSQGEFTFNGEARKFKAAIDNRWLMDSRNLREEYENQFRDGNKPFNEYEINHQGFLNAADSLDKLFDKHLRAGVPDSKLRMNTDDGSCSDHLVGTTILLDNGDIISIEAGVEAADEKKMMMRRRVSSKPQNSTRANLRSMFRRMSL